jgi:REP element-mobilizing transposase RayT
MKNCRGMIYHAQYNPTEHHRHSIRLKGYDYSRPGAYFITICTYRREMFLDFEPIRQIVPFWWDKLSEKFEGIDTDEFVIMPNHVRGIIFIVGVDPCVYPNLVGADPCVYPKQKGEHTGSPLHRIVQWFKTMPTNNYIRGAKEEGRKPFHDKFWQRNYYEHIIRNEEELNRIREYIPINPLKWQFDRENPHCIQDKTYDHQWCLFEEVIYGKRKH